MGYMQLYKLNKGITKKPRQSTVQVLDIVRYDDKASSSVSSSSLEM